MVSTRAPQSLMRDWITEAHKAGYQSEALARRLGLTEPELEKLIREHFRVTGKDYLRALQINYAVGRLEAGESIGKTALKSHFKTQPQFSREFKKLVGVSPSAYLKQRKGRVHPAEGRDSG
jgi:AraC-like DNA-binding protein